MVAFNKIIKKINAHLFIKQLIKANKNHINKEK